MSQETVEILRTAYAAWNAGDRRSMLDDIDPDVAWEQNLDVAGLDRVYRGHDGFLRWVQEAVGIWGQFRAEPLDFIDAGEHVVVPVRMTDSGSA